MTLAAELPAAGSGAPRASSAGEEEQEDDDDDERRDIVFTKNHGLWPRNRKNGQTGIFVLGLQTRYAVWRSRSH